MSGSAAAAWLKYKRPTSKLRIKGVFVKLPCKLPPDSDDIRPRRAVHSRQEAY